MVSATSSARPPRPLAQSADDDRPDYPPPIRGTPAPPTSEGVPPAPTCRDGRFCQTNDTRRHAQQQDPLSPRR
eukprot:2808454-Prymnesium_polylepis.1